MCSAYINTIYVLSSFYPYLLLFLPSSEAVDLSGWVAILNAFLGRERKKERKKERKREREKERERDSENKNN